MDEIVEEIALAPVVSQNEDDEVLKKKEFNRKSEKFSLFIRIFNSKPHLKKFVLWIILLICLLFIAGSLSFHISYSVPIVKRRNIADDIFSEERALDYLINLTQFGSRVINTRGNIDARNFLISQIERIYLMNKRNLQFEIELQNFTDFYHNQLQNILVRISNPVTKMKNVSSLMLSAHYDSVEFSRGSCDDGSGVVILLELLYNLVNDLTINFSNVHLIILFTNAEESRLDGARAFIANHNWRFNINRFINVDSVSCNEVAILVQMKPSKLVIDYSRVSRPRANVILENILQLFGMSADYDIYSLIGSLSGYDFGFLYNGYIYHTLLDQTSIFKRGVIQDLGENLGILIRNILKENIEEIKNYNDNDSFIYFDLFSQYLIVYKMSTSIIIQIILIILIIIISIILIIFDDIYHRRKSFICNDYYCIYNYFKSPLKIRIISIIIYVISNILSICISILVAIGYSWIISKIRPFLWFGNSTLSIFLYSFPCLISFILIEYICNIFHNVILQKSSSKNNNSNINKISFDFEQNLSINIIYILLMIISIIINNRSFYIILLWSIFICPMILVLMLIQFIIHWKEIEINFLKKKYYWLFFPLIISIFPLSHTIDIINRLIHIIIPYLSRILSYKSYFLSNLICFIICIPSIFILMIFIPILQRTKYFSKILIIFLINFIIIFLIAYNRQTFTNIYPSTFYAKHISKSTFEVNKLTNIPFSVPLISQSSLIAVITDDHIDLSPILDQFSDKSGHILHNKKCMKPTKCIFNDTFNRTMPIQNIEIESMKNFQNYTIIIRHVLSYNIQISSYSFIKFIVRNQLIIPRTETIIDVISYSKLFSFNINVKIRRCDLSDSPFLLLFTNLMKNILLTGKGQCQAIDDDATLIFDIQHTTS